MTAVRSCLLTVCVLALTAAPAAAATDWTPVGQPVTGSAINTSLKYGSVTVQCATSSFVGTTRNPANTGLDVTLTFGGCKVGLLNATANCAGTVTLNATDAKNTWGLTTFDSNFGCNFGVTAICNVSVAGPQTFNELWDLNEADTVLYLSLNTIAATRTGSAACGAASGVASFAAAYAVTPASLAIS